MFSIVHLQKETFGGFYIKHLHKNYSKSSGPAAWRCPEKKMFLKISQN